MKFKYIKEIHCAKCGGHPACPGVMLVEEKDKVELIKKIKSEK